MDNLITVKPKVKLKGFDRKNLKIIAGTKDDQQIKHRINRLMSTSFFDYS